MDHLGIDRTAAHRAILTGDPERVPAIAAHLGGERELTARRGFVCWQAVDSAEAPLLVVATGIGAPATAIVVEELVDLGIHTIVRVGSCGALQPEIGPNDVVVATGCVRDEGTSDQYVERGFPSVPDLALTAGILEAVNSRVSRCHSGLVHCKDAYYLEHADRQLLPEETARRWQALRSAGVTATEMESSVLFVLGSLRRVRTASALVAVGPEPDPVGFDRSLQGVVAALSTVLADFPPPARMGLVRPAGARSSFLEGQSE